MFVLSSKLNQKFKNKRYRDAFVASRVRNWIAYQIRAIREQRDWSQKEFEKKTGKPQSVISRLENPSYGKVTVQTLLDVASAFNVALIVKFVDFSTFLRQTEDVSPKAMQVEEYGQELAMRQDADFVTVDSPFVLAIQMKSEEDNKISGHASDHSVLFLDVPYGGTNKTITTEHALQ